jgi:hypothetical protein
MVKALAGKIGFVLIVALAATAAVTAFMPAWPGRHPFPGVTYVQEDRQNPLLHTYWLKVDLTNPAIHLRLCPGGDRPDGDGPWETILCPVSKIAERENLDIAINGSYFTPRSAEIIFGHHLPYFEGNWAKASCWTVSDGRLWSANPVGGRIPTFIVTPDGHASIHLLDGPPLNVSLAVSGNWLVMDGHVHAPTDQLAPRTAIGVDADGKTLVIFVCDGCRPAAGMSMLETGEEMVKLGCYRAINLDSGGSSTLVMRHGAKWQVIDRPSDGQQLPIPLSIERPVANALGIIVDEK